MLKEPGHIDERNDPNPGNLLEMGESLLKWVLAAVGMILVLSGLLLSLSVFGVVRDIIIAPEENMGTYFDGWELVLQSPEPEVAPVAVTIPATAEMVVPVVTEVPAAEKAPESVVADSPVENVPDATAAPAKPAHPINKLRHRQETEKARATDKYPSGNLFMELANKLLNTITDGHIARPIGAIFILLLAGLLIRIPFYLIRMGIHTFSMLLAAQKGDKPPPMPKM